MSHFPYTPAGSLLITDCNHQAIATDGDVDLVRLLKRNMPYNTEGCVTQPIAMHHSWGDPDSMGLLLAAISAGHNTATAATPAAAAGTAPSSPAEAPAVAAAAAAASAVPAPPAENAAAIASPAAAAAASSSSAAAAEPAPAPAAAAPAPAVDLVLISDVIYGSNPGVWDRLIASLLALTTPGRTLVLQSESFRLEALLYHEYWACLEQAGFRVTEVAVGGASLGWGEAGLLGIVAQSMKATEEGGLLPPSDDSVLPQAPAVAKAVAPPPPPPPPPRENAVLVLGSTGRIGRKVVKRLLASGRTVIAAARSESKATQVFGAMEMAAGVQPGGKGILFVEAGLDVTDAASIGKAAMWKGVSQVVNCLGPVFGPLPGGGFGTIDNMSSERVEAEGCANLMAVLPSLLKRQARTTRWILPMATAEDLTQWDKLDDVIMGGFSSSELVPLPADVATTGGVGGAAWKGMLVLEGGGFCGTRTKKLDLNLADADGLYLRVKGDGQTFKVNIKTVEQESQPESTYQTTFDTVAGSWSDVYLPWHNFVPVKRNQSDPEGAPLSPSAISKFGLVLSRFEFNKMPNPKHLPGAFELQVEGGLGVFSTPRPQILQISSAGVERNAIIGDDLELRKLDIPIIQLNPGGTLNHKYSAEVAVRASGYPYTVVRFTGTIDSNEGGPYLMEADQGDVIIGQLSRDDAADVIVAALADPESVGKTYEVRRAEAVSQVGVRDMARKDFDRMFLKQALDTNRWRVGLQPFPKYMPPPPPADEQRTKEILAQVATIRGTAPAPAAPTPPEAAAAPAPAPETAGEKKLQQQQGQGHREQLGQQHSAQQADERSLISPATALCTALRCAPDTDEHTGPVWHSGACSACPPARSGQREAGLKLCRLRGGKGALRGRESLARGGWV
ncbi:MAG: hypothetical protein WDW36_006435 [Sanguina aurantia]